MRPYFETENGKLYCGDARKVLKELEDESVDVIITSPPYWAKRWYGDEANTVWGGDENCEHEWVEIDVRSTKLFSSGYTDYKFKSLHRSRVKPGMICRKCGAWYGQLGLEPTPFLFVEHLFEVFELAKTLLKQTGNLFVNIDDTYFGSGTGNDTKKPISTPYKGIGKRKSLALVPELFAVKMVYEGGWILREKIIWAKKVMVYKERRNVGNAMPDPARDRFSHSWEYVYHFTLKPSKYYFNLDAVRVPFSTETIARMFRNTMSEKLVGAHKGVTLEKQKTFQMKLRSKFLEYDQQTRSLGGRVARILANGEADKRILVRRAIDDVNGYLKRKLREKGLTIKQLAEVTGIKESTLAHYFRTDLSGSAIPPRRVWEKLKPILDLDDYDKHVKEEYKSVLPVFNELGANPGNVVQINVKPFKGAHFATFPYELPELLIKASSPEGGVVLDPFAGAGTTLIVAEKLGRKWIGIEINKEFCKLIKDRFESELFK